MSVDFKIHRQELNWGGKKLVLETGKLARQADGAVVVSLGETVVLCTVVGEKEAKPNIDFFPLTVHYQEKAFAAGRIPGGFIKREGKPSEREILISRLIDRPLRPLFPEGFYNEIQVICTTLSHDFEHDAEIAAMVGASASLAISGIPFLGPIGAARVGFSNGQYILNPPLSQLKESVLDLVVAGTEEGVLIVESEAQELSEEQMLEAVLFGHKAFQPVIKLIKKFKAQVKNKAWDITDSSKEEKELIKKIQKNIGKELKKAFAIQDKQECYKTREKLQIKARESLQEEVKDERLFNQAFKNCEAMILREDILKKGKRIDGRDLATIRPIECEIGVLPRTHGSALFTRGETQALVVSTLGTSQDEQIVDALEGEYRERFMLHYNFPPYAVGETGRFGSPGRREIGHGRLAWRAIRPLIPIKDQFPYVIRTVSEITESNGSSSMATVCGASMSLMDAGVPLPRPIAGIAMGLIKEKDDFAVLSDILGDEDHLGDMDFKVAGTELGITALQMDIKITSITHEIMKIALEQAKTGRLHILKEMACAITHSKGSVSLHAPKMSTMMIPKDKIRDLIGPGGKTIRELCETTVTKIDIEEEGMITISAVDPKAIETAMEAIKILVFPPEVGTIYIGKIVKIMDFGAFVSFSSGKEGLVHISEIKAERINKVSDIVKVGDEVKVKVIGFDDRGKIKLSMKAVGAINHSQ